MPFTSLIKLIPKYFILFDAIVNKIVFVISFSDCSLFMYRNVTDFCMLTLHTSTLLNLFVLMAFVWSLYGFLQIRSYHLQTEIILLLPYQFGWLFFSCLIPLDTTSSTTLNRSGESRHPCLIPDLRRKAFSLSPLSMMFAVSFS